MRPQTETRIRRMTNERTNKQMRGAVHRIRILLLANLCVTGAAEKTRNRKPRRTAQQVAVEIVGEGVCKPKNPMAFISGPLDYDTRSVAEP